MENKILVTGISGFIGQSLIKYFEKSQGFSLKGYDRSQSTEQLTNHKFSAIVHLAGIAHDLSNKNDWDKYYKGNTLLTQDLFEAFLLSDIEVFVFVSTVKAVLDGGDHILTETVTPNPQFPYGKSKLLAETYILEKGWPNQKRVYILRPAMVHGPGNKGNLNLLYHFCKYFRFWPLGSFDNERSFCSVYNLCFVIDELARRRDVESGVYNVADDTTISTNEIISIISSKFGKKIRNLKIPKSIILIGLNISSFLGIHALQLKFQKLTENFIVSNSKIKLALGKPLPVAALEGIKKTIDSFE